MNIALCDDETIYIQTIEHDIRLWSRANNVEHAITILPYRSGEELLERHAEGQRIDALFLDIQFPNEENGMYIVKEIHHRQPELPVVFITNYGEYVYEGYTVNALRFLRKPVVQADIDECMKILWHQYSLSQKDTILIEAPPQTLRLPSSSILYSEALGRTCRLRITDPAGEYCLRIRFRDIQQLLPTEIFVQCHRSYLVNIQYVRRFTRSDIYMSNGDRIPLSRKYSAAFLNLFQTYYQGGTVE